jgi:L-ascorbate metabolism protein UlaG (beta-lactamase superfamily)
MRKLLLCFTISLSASFLHGQSNVDITFIANDGFLLNDENHKILIDAIFSEGSGMFTTPPSAVLLQERNGTAPFDSIDFVLNTHYHADHINAEYVAEHLVNDTGSVWVGPPQSYDLLATEESFGTVEDRIISLLPGIAVKTDTIINDFPVRIVRLIHYNNSDYTLQNLGYIFTLGDIKIFHPGDGYFNDTVEVENLDLADDSIDILFLSYRVLDNNFENLGRKIIEYLNPKALLVMHIKINEAEYYRDLVAGLQNLPPIYIMEEPMGNLSFAASGDSLIVGENVGLISKEETYYSSFPNPAGDKITVLLNHETSSIVKCEIFDLLGNRMTSMFIQPGENELSVNISRYPKGVYVLKISENGRFHSSIFVH